MGSSLRPRRGRPAAPAGARRRPPPLVAARARASFHGARLTPRGLRLLLAAPVLYATGEALGFVFLRALAGLALGLVAAGLLATSGRLAVTVTRTVSPARVERDGDAAAVLLVTNPGRRRIAGFTAEDRVGTRRVELRIPALPAGATHEHRYLLPTSRRGRVPVGPVALYRADPLGLAATRVIQGAGADLWVYPRTRPTRALPSGTSHAYTGASGDGPRHGSVDFHSLREYVVGDELRHLHWKSTARTGQLMVREFVDLRCPRLTVLLETRADRVDAAAFEEIVEVAASLVRASTARGLPTRLLTTTGPTTTTDLDIGTTRPTTTTDLDVDTAGGAGARDLLDRLAEVGRRPGTTRVRRPADLVADEAAGTSLVMVTEAVDAGDLRELALLRQRLDRVVVLSLGPAPRQDGDEVPGVPVLRGPDAVALLGAWNTAVCP